MLGNIWNFVKRHRRKFVFTGAVIGGIWALGKYAKYKLAEMQEREAAECLAHAKKQHHFDSNQRTCNMTVFSMLPTLKEALQQALNSEELTAILKEKPENKLAIWEELKIISFSRTICAAYSISILIAMLRVQLNIIGGYMYLDSVKTSESPEDVQTSTAIQQRYLANIQYVLNEGLKDLIEHVKSSVTLVLSDKSLKQQICLRDVQAIFHDVRKNIERSDEGTGCSQLVQYMMPPIEVTNGASLLEKEDIFLRQLDEETRDMLESHDFDVVLTSLLDMAFMKVVDQIAEYYKSSCKQSNGTITSLVDSRIPLAKVIPIVNGILYTILAQAPNAYAQELLLKEQVRDFAANVYESFSSQLEPGPSIA